MLVASYSSYSSMTSPKSRCRVSIFIWGFFYKLADFHLDDFVGLDGDFHDALNQVGASFNNVQTILFW